MKLVAILILISLIYMLFDLLIWNGWFYQMTISRIPHSDFYACRKMLFNLHKMELVEESSGEHVYHIKGSKFYMVVFDDDLYDLYYANNLEELGSSYSIGGVSLQSTWNSLIKHKIGQILYVWHTTKRGKKENNKSKELTMDAVDIIHIGKRLIPQETSGKKFEYIPCLFEPPYMELMEFSEFKKIMCKSKKKIIS